MRQILISICLIFSLSITVNSQINYSAKIETGYMQYLFRIISVDPGPNWKGYNLAEEQNGINVTIVNGFTFMDKKIFAGIGIGYLNFEGIDGVSVVTDIDYLLFKARLTPMVNIKLGYDHIWNQYDHGTRTAHAEFCIGLNYKLTEKFGLYFKSGMLLTQQSFLVPLTIGFRY